MDTAQHPRQSGNRLCPWRGFCQDELQREMIRPGAAPQPSAIRLEQAGETGLFHEMPHKKKSPAKRLALLIGTTKGVFIYHSDESRKKWKLTGPHLSGWEVYSLAGDSRNGRI